MERRYLSHYRKHASSHKISLKPGNRLLNNGQKRFLKWRLSAILNFKNFHIWSPGCHRIPNVQSCTQFYQNRMIFRWDMAIAYTMFGRRPSPRSWVILLTGRQNERSHKLNSTSLGLVTISSAVAERPRDALCLSVVSFNIPTARFFITSYCGFRFAGA